MLEITLLFKNLLLTFPANYPNKIWIGRKDGEGGQFDVDELEKVIEKFYEEHF